MLGHFYRSIHMCYDLDIDAKARMSERLVRCKQLDTHVIIPPTRIDHYITEIIAYSPKMTPNCHICSINYNNGLVYIIQDD